MTTISVSATGKFPSHASQPMLRSISNSEGILYAKRLDLMCLISFGNYPPISITYACPTLPMVSLGLSTVASLVYSSLIAGIGLILDLEVNSATLGIQRELPGFPAG